ncbi:diguanylate cyclase [Dechloromonas sp. H13]|uniref:diguanylate cyclase n=1 Tax=Dechloromonas sp. H13 TaxID=2570193 RepID=UPI00129144AB|nr:diguanylate cyclase [Dechloromonas sp. H13]
MRFGLRLHFLLLLACVAVLGGVAGYRFYAWYSGEMVTVFGQRFAERNVLYEKSRVLGMVTREVTLVQKMATSQVLRAWLADEANPQIARAAISELEEYREFLRDRSYCFVFAGSGNYYYNDARGGANLYLPRYTVSPSIAKDAWFYLTLKGGRTTQLNIDTDRHTRLTKVWINTIVHDALGKPAAIACSGLDLTDFINGVVSSDLPGVMTVFFDRHGAIQGHQDVTMIDFASARKAAGKEAQNTVFNLLDRPEDEAALQRAMAALVGGRSEVEALDLVVQGRRQLIGLTWLPEIQWFILTMTPPTAAVGGNGLASAVLLLIVALNLVLLAALLILQKTVVSRVVRLDALAKAFGDSGHRVDIPEDRSGDEIGRLTQTFRTMSERIACHTEELEREVAERTEKLERMAQTDFLTGVMNRRGMMSRLEVERNRLARAGTLMGLLIVDVDYFKAINDTHGHAVGDQALVAVAGMLQHMVRDYDLLARWGGEEFLVALPGLKHLGELQAVADKLLGAIRSQPIVCGEIRLPLTVSIGGVFADPQANLDAIIHCADTALYRAKNEGRDRVVLECLLIGEDAAGCRELCPACDCTPPAGEGGFGA